MRFYPILNVIRRPILYVVFKVSNIFVTNYAHGFRDFRSKPLILAGGYIVYDSPKSWYLLIFTESGCVSVFWSVRELESERNLGSESATKFGG